MKPAIIRSDNLLDVLSKELEAIIILPLNRLNLRRNYIQHLWLLSNLFHINELKVIRIFAIFKKLDSSVHLNKNLTICKTEKVNIE